MPQRPQTRLLSSGRPGGSSEGCPQREQKRIGFARRPPSPLGVQDLSIRIRAVTARRLEHGSAPVARPAPRMQRFAAERCAKPRASGIATRDSLSGGSSKKETDGRSAGALGVRDPEGDRELPRVGRARPGAGRALARAHQGGGRARERRARAARRRARRAHRERRRRGGRRPARRPVPHRRLPDRLGHLLQHERQRGDREPRRRGRPPERPREHGPVVERRLPVGRAPRRGLGGPGRAPPGSSAAVLLALREGGRVRRRRQGGPHAHDGRGAGDARPGVRRLRGPDPARARPRQGHARPCFADPPGRDGDGHRAEHASGVRRAGALTSRAWARSPWIASRRRGIGMGWSSCTGH